MVEVKISCLCMETEVFIVILMIIMFSVIKDYCILGIHGFSRPPALEIEITLVTKMIVT